MTKRFHIGDVLSVTTPYLVSLSGIEGVYRILDHMTRDSLFTHQLPRGQAECRPWLLRCFPRLAEVDGEDLQVALQAPAIVEADAALERAERWWLRRAATYREYRINGDIRIVPARIALDAAKREEDEARATVKQLRHAIVSEWLAEKAKFHGEWFDVEPIPADDHARRDPVAELEQMAPGKTIVTAEEDLDS